MPITIYDLAKFRGAKESEEGTINMGAFINVKLPMLGGCIVCSTSIAAYNACPSKSGVLKCLRSCIGDDGYDTVEEGK